MRLFIGIDLPSKIKKKISQEIIRKLARKYPQIRWEKEEKLHLTLKFLGNTKIKLRTQTSNVKRTSQISKLEEIAKGMRKAVLGVEPFKIRIGRLGCFLNRSLVVRLGVEKFRNCGKNQRSPLEQLAGNLDKEMAKLGFAREKRPFYPHITLGRARKMLPWQKRGRIAEEIIKLTNYQAAIGNCKVERITLFESQLSRAGSVYKKIKEIAF